MIDMAIAKEIQVCCKFFSFEESFDSLYLDNSGLSLVVVVSLLIWLVVLLCVVFLLLFIALLFPFEIKVGSE